MLACHLYNSFIIAKCNTAIGFLTQMISLCDAILVFLCVTQITIQCLAIIINIFITP